jgi:hypothetical protein
MCCTLICSVLAAPLFHQEFSLFCVGACYGLLSSEYEQSEHKCAHSECKLGLNCSMRDVRLEALEEVIIQPSFALHIEPCTFYIQISVDSGLLFSLVSSV